MQIIGIVEICGIRVRRGGHIVLPVSFFAGAKDEGKHIVIKRF